MTAEIASGEEWAPLRPPVSYYGSKSRLARKLVRLLPPHRVYVEPFAGSAAMLLAKRPAPVEVINDLDGDVANFFAMLRDRPGDLVRACWLTPYSREEYAAAKDRGEDLDPIERARRWWVRCCQSVNGGGAGGRAGWAISTTPKSNAAGEAARRADALMAVAARLRGVYVEHRPAIDLIARHTGPDVLIYADPPYLATTRTGRERSRGRDYTHDTDAELDHRQLADALRTTDATVLVSGYDSPLYDELYAGWHRMEIPLAKPSANHSGAKNRRAVEVVWFNRPLADDTTLGVLPLTFPTTVTEPSAAAETRNETPGPDEPASASCNETSCEAPGCDHAVQQPTTGRRRRFCSAACRVRAHRHRGDQQPTTRQGNS